MAYSREKELDDARKGLLKGARLVKQGDLTEAIEAAQYALEVLCRMAIYDDSEAVHTGTG